MGVLINTKICDNAMECGGISVCPTGALFWDQDNNTIAIDNNLCINCHECEKECPVEAIKVADTNEEFDAICKEIEQDERKAEDLFVERYGAMPIDENKVIDTLPDVSLGITFIEEFCDDSIQCLLHSIPVEFLVQKYNCKYYKLHMDGNADSYPKLKIYNNNKFLGEISGYYDDTCTHSFLERIDHIVSKEI